VRRAEAGSHSPKVGEDRHPRGGSREASACVGQLFIGLDDVQAKIFTLPKWPTDKEATKRMWREEFLPWAHANGLTQTQIDAVTKKLNEHGYYINEKPVRAG
jgi:hypothetical protein